jgi:succinate dehydrogenase / fumarate reductase, cytochrome b subunit
MPSRQRPLSPHLQIYRWQITMLMSILHRASGIVLALGALGLAWWLHAVATGGESYVAFQAVIGSIPGQVALFAFSAALVYHLLNGIRHLLWDAGRGYGIPKVYASGYTVWTLTVLFTAAIWAVVLIGANP